MRVVMPRTLNLSWGVLDDRARRLEGNVGCAKRWHMLEQLLLQGTRDLHRGG